MSVAGRHKTFMAPFHTLISCDIPFVLFRIDFQHESQCILERVSICFVASEFSNLNCRTWQLLYCLRHVIALPVGITTLCLLMIFLTFFQEELMIGLGSIKVSIFL